MGCLGVETYTPCLFLAIVGSWYSLKPPEEQNACFTQDRQLRRSIVLFYSVSQKKENGKK